MKLQQLLKEKFFENQSGENVREVLEKALLHFTASDDFAQLTGLQRVDTVATILDTAKFIDEIETNGDCLLAVANDDYEKAKQIRDDIRGAVHTATYGKGLTMEQQDELTAKVAAFLQAETDKTEAAATDPDSGKNVTVNIEKLIDVLHVTPNTDDTKQATA